jgi:uncharacterized protein (TIGR03790 family)
MSAAVSGSDDPSLRAIPIHRMAYPLSLLRFLSLLFFTVPLLAINPSEVVVLYSTTVPESKDVADHYARLRGIPDSNKIGLHVVATHAISRSNYIHEIQNPLLETLSNRGLISFTRFHAPPTNTFAGGPAIRVTSSSVRCLVLCWGLPYNIHHDPSLVTAAHSSLPDPVRRNDASVDSEIALLPALGSYDLIAALPNPFHATTNRALFHPSNGIFLVGRLDGPTPQIAKDLVNKALSCETNGFAGNAYVDVRGISAGSYAIGDKWMNSAADLCRRVGFSTYVDSGPETIPAHFPLSHVGIYVGWYSAGVDGPFALPEVEFMPGAIAYHLHSFNGHAPRDPAASWVGPLLARGATVTFGTVSEPYLEFTANPHVFLELLAAGEFTVGEAALASLPYLSWVNVFYGDPLFTPFRRDLTREENRQLAIGSPSLPWTVLRKANFLQKNGSKPIELAESLAKYPPTATNAVLAEKTASLFAESSRIRFAVEWAHTALAHHPSPQQRTRILLNLAEWLVTAERRDEAFDTLLLVEQERPDYQRLIPFRERQLRLARDVIRRPEIDRLKTLIEILKAPPSTNNPASPPSPPSR